MSTDATRLDESLKQLNIVAEGLDEDSLRREAAQARASLQRLRAACEPDEDDAQTVVNSP